MNTPSKEDRQKWFKEHCDSLQLSVKGIVLEASVFPKNMKSKVIKWPKL